MLTLQRRSESSDITYKQKKLALLAFVNTIQVCSLAMLTLCERSTGLKGYPAVALYPGYSICVCVWCRFSSPLPLGPWAEGGRASTRVTVPYLTPKPRLIPRTPISHTHTHTGTGAGSSNAPSRHKSARRNLTGAPGSPVSRLQTDVRSYMKALSARWPSCEARGAERWRGERASANGAASDKSSQRRRMTLWHWFSHIVSPLARLYKTNYAQQWWILRICTKYQ